MKKILKYYKNNKLLIRRKVALLANLLVESYPYLVIFAYSLLVIETFTYPGFLVKYLFVNSQIFVFATLTIGSLFLLKDFKKKISKGEALMHLILSLNKLFFPVIVLLYLIFTAEEEKHFPNYVFSTYHIHLSQFRYLFLLNIGLIFLSFILNNKNNILRWSKKWQINQEFLDIKNPKYIYAVSIFLIVFWILMQNLTLILTSTIESFPFIITHPFTSFEAKHAKKISLYYYFKFVVDHTPENAHIAIPPQMNPWLTEGNGGYVRYFFYPRKELNIELSDPIPDWADYVLICHGSWAAPDPELYGWPKEKLDAEKIWSYDLETKQVTETENTTFDPNTNTIKWGLIKRKK